MATWTDIKNKLSTIHSELSVITADIAEMIAIENLDDPVTPPVDPPPRLVVSGGSDVLTEVEKTITLTAVATGGTAPVNVRWAVNGLEYPGSTITLSFPKSGTYVATVEATDAAGNRATDDVQITVKGVTPPLATTIHCGPGTDFAEPHLVPFNSLQPNTKVNILYRQAPYPSKLVLQRSDIPITGLSSPNGEPPALQAENATENVWNTDWTSQLIGKGLISVIKRSANESVNNIRVVNLDIRGAREGVPYTTATGLKKAYAKGTAGVYAITCDGVEVSGCRISGNDNGVFAVSNAGWQGVNTVRNMKLSGNRIIGNGVAGSDRCHNTYIEGIATVYEFNEYGYQNGSGAELKDRSAGVKIRFNQFTGPSSDLLDIVDPEEGAPILTTAPEWGRDYIYGNIIRNNVDCALIHFGYDGLAQNTRPQLFFYNNTMINTGDNWKTFWFRMHGGRLVLFNNILWNNSTDAMRLYTGLVAPTSWIQGSWLSQGTAQTSDPNSWTVPLNPGFAGWNDPTANKFGANPGLNADATLKADSPCRGMAKPLSWMMADMPELTHHWNGSTWVRRTSFLNAGAAE